MINISMIRTFIQHLISCIVTDIPAVFYLGYLDSEEKDLADIWVLKKKMLLIFGKVVMMCTEASKSWLLH